MGTGMQRQDWVALAATLAGAAVLFWGWLWGIAGMLIAVPMLIIIKVVCSHVEHWEPIGTFLDRS